MKENNIILCINGSDSMGNSGIQADIRTIRDLGGYAVTAVTSVTVQNSQGITQVHNLPADLVVGQVRAIYEEVRPDAVKVGMVNDPATIRGIRNEIVGCRCVVCSPVILSSYGGMLMSNDALQTYCEYLLPISTLLIIKCVDAEVILGRRISTDRDMIVAARDLHDMGAEHVLLRGGTYAEGRINALLWSPSISDKEGRWESFSSANIAGWQRHGVGGTLSTAIGARLALGDDVTDAVSNAHKYMHTQVVYHSSSGASAHGGGMTSGMVGTIYDRFMTLLSNRYSTAHDVAFYASELCISTRYLSQITGTVCGRSPKQVIDDYIIRQSEQLLRNTTLTIQQISNELGFASQVAFAKFFKAKKGYSPSMFRGGIKQRQE